MLAAASQGDAYPPFLTPHPTETLASGTVGS